MNTIDLSSSGAGALRVFSDREWTLCAIERRLREQSIDLPHAIRKRQLYFRVSVVGSCNLSCPFCHNEGAPARGRIPDEAMQAAVVAARRVGFDRIQLTGGEPLIHPAIAGLVRFCRRHFDDVGITTNGTYLDRALVPLVEAGIARIHVSLQTESLVAAGDSSDWGVPPWLAPTLEMASAGAFTLRLNLPVGADDIDRAGAFLRRIDCDIKVFSILPEGQLRSAPYPLTRLEDMVRRANAERIQRNCPGRVELRGYRPPTGIRCGTCADLDRCKEQSHSLRLGADLILRPCLATRAWDQPLTAPFESGIRDAALLALDYEW